MVSRHCHVLLLLLTLTGNGLALAGFEASLDRTSIALGEAVQLTLTLHNSHAEEQPEWERLNKDFDIVRRANQSSVQIVNGQYKRTQSWVLTLEPRRPGDLVIPILAIRTDRGVETTEPLALTVGPAGSLPDAAPDNSVILKVSVSDPSPYQQQSILYRVDILSQDTLIQPELTEPDVEGAILEEVREPWQRTEVRNGRRVTITTVTYALTPLRPGKLTIPPSRLRTRLLEPGRSGIYFPFGRRDYQTLVLASDAVSLDVRPPVPGVAPWLPLHNLHIEEEWQALDSLRSGEPVTRTLTLVAEGIQGQQLPALTPEEQGGFKIYGEHPEFENGLSPGHDRLTSTRREVHTLIPQQAGRLQVPRIRIPWWDVDEEKLKFAETPPRWIDVANRPGSHPAAAGMATTETAGDESPPPSAEPGSIPVATAPWERVAYYGFGVASALLLVFASFLWKKHANPTWKGKAKRGTRSRQYSNRALRRKLRGAGTPGEINRLVRDFARARYGIAAWSWPNLVREVTRRNPRISGETLTRLGAELDGALFGNQALDVARWVRDFDPLAREFPCRENARQSVEGDLPPLNP